MRVSETVERIGVRSTHFYAASFYAASLGSIGLCIGLWIRAKTVDQDERGNAERRALFVGLWPPMFWLMGDTLKDSE
jgi:hypothetical protein